MFTVGGTGVFTRQFTLEQVDGEWRITDPPDGLIILQPDFERLYDARDALLPRPHRAAGRPRPALLIKGDAQPTALVQRLIDGPVGGPDRGGCRQSADRRRAAQRGHRGRRDGRRGPDRARGRPGAVPLGDLRADRLDPVAAAGATVEIRVDGEPVDIEGVPAQQTVEDWATYDPDAVPAGRGRPLPQRRCAAHGDHRGAVAGPAGTGGYGLSSAAVSADPRTGKLSFLVGVRHRRVGRDALRGPVRR